MGQSSPWLSANVGASRARPVEATRNSARGLGLLGAPASERNDRLAQGKAAIGQRVGPGVVPERQTGQYAGRFELAQAGREHVRRHSEVALQIAVALRPVEQPLDDE